MSRPRSTHDTFLRVTGTLFLLIAVGVLVYALLISERSFFTTERGLIAILVAICTGAGVAVLTGTAVIKGQIPAIGPLTTPFTIGAGGGIATMIIVYLVLHWTFVRGPEPGAWFLHGPGTLGTGLSFLERTRVSDPRSPEIEIVLEDERLPQLWLDREWTAENPLQAAQQLCVHPNLECLQCEPPSRAITRGTEEVRVSLRPGVDLLAEGQLLRCP